MSSASTTLWQEAFGQFERLLGLQITDREAELATLARERPDVHVQVLALLDAERRGEDTRSLGLGWSGVMTSTATRAIGSFVGPYLLDRQLGVGGMGEVWLAKRRDGVSDALVAIKLLHGHLTASSLRERFAREGKILGQLTHQNIARLLDAGVAPSGELYLALEYIEGLPLDRWCDDRKLDVASRVKLFLQVCDAVAHAHARLIVHRDLKPSNIMVTPEGVAKLLDFGIAKLVESTEGAAAQTELTRVGGRVLTPEYAAPEQLCGEAITVAADVYSLGVILYGLLTGRRPYLSSGSLSQLEREVLETDPPPASAAAGSDVAAADRRQLSVRKLREALRGDLDTILQKALKKAPSQRYGSVTALAEDLRRYLDHEPVLARPDSLVYRVRKYVRRNRVAAGASAVIALTLVAGVAATLWQAQRAEARAEELRQVVEFQGATLDRVNVARFGAQFQQRVRERLQRRLGQGRTEDIGDPQAVLPLLDRLVPYAGLTDAARDTLASQMIQPAEDEIEQHFAGKPRIRAALLDSLGRSCMTLALFARAEQLYARATQLHAQVEGPQAPATLDSHLGHAEALIRLARYAEARTEVAAVAEARRASLGPEAPPTVKAEALEIIVLAVMSDYDGTRSRAEALLPRIQRVLGPADPATLRVMSNLGAAYDYRGEVDKAVKILRDAADLANRSLGPVHLETFTARNNLANALLDAGLAADSRTVFAALVDDMRREFGDDDPKVLLVESNLANAMVSAGDQAAAMALEKTIIDTGLRRSGPDEIGLLMTEANYAIDLRDTGQTAEAVKLLDDVVQRYARIEGPEHTDTLAATSALATAERANRNFKRAATLGEQTLAAQTRNLGADQRLTVETLGELAETYFQMKRFERAHEFGERAAAAYRKLWGEQHPDTLAELEHVVAYRRAAGDETGARTLESELAALRAPQQRDASQK